jgi:hypothetical protein
MNFIEVKQGIKIRKSEIICIEKTDDMTCKVYTAIGEYDSIYPYQTLSMLLEMGNIEEQISTTPAADNRPDRLNLYGAQHWAG